MTVTSNNRATVTLPTEKQILIEREFDAPRELVYKAYTTPELVKRWWHAKRGEVTLVEIDLRVGGRWRYVMVTRTDAPAVYVTGQDAGEIAIWASVSPGFSDEATDRIVQSFLTPARPVAAANAS